MSKSEPIPAADLHNLLTYDPDTGALVWKPRTVAMCVSLGWCRWFNARFANKPAFSAVNSRGYLTGKLFGATISSHRVIWAMQTGQWPPDAIDHINGNRTDNRWGNLRVVTGQENQRNRKTGETNKSGVTGVSWDQKNAKWTAGIGVNGKTIRLGQFSNFDAAVAARKAAEIHYNFHANHGR